MILLIDNYDSFSYNLVQMVGECHSDIRVIRNDEMTVDEIRAQHPSHIKPGEVHYVKNPYDVPVKMVSTLAPFQEADKTDAENPVY